MVSYYIINILSLIIFLFFAYKSFVELSLVMAIVAIPLWFFFLFHIPNTWHVILIWVNTYIKTSRHPDFLENYKDSNPDFLEDYNDIIRRHLMRGIILTPMFIIFLRYFLPKIFG